MTDITETLTEGEQREIRQYITARLAGGEINMNALPLWLFDLEQTRHKEQQLRVELKRVLAALWLVYDLYNKSIVDFKKLHPDEYPLATQDEKHIWEIVERVLYKKDT